MTEELIKRLLPCPFCGSAASLFEHTDAPGKWFARCDPCDLIRDQAWYVTEAEAISAWNTRLYDEVLGVGVERIQSEGASSDEDRAVVPAASSPQAVSPVPASIPSADLHALFAEHAERVAECPFNKPPYPASNKRCPKCDASASEGCPKQSGADAMFFQQVRTLLKRADDVGGEA